MNKYTTLLLILVGLTVGCSHSHWRNDAEYIDTSDRTYLLPQYKITNNGLVIKRDNRIIVIKDSYEIKFKKPRLTAKEVAELKQQLEQREIDRQSKSDSGVTFFTNTLLFDGKTKRRGLFDYQ